MKLSLDEASILELGKEAEFLQAKLSPYFDQLEKRIISQLKLSWQTESASKDIEMRTQVGMLVAIEGLRNMFLGKINQANKIQVEKKQMNAQMEELKDEHGLELRPYD